MSSASDASGTYRGAHRWSCGYGRLDARGWDGGFGRRWHPFEILAMVLGFIVFWPIGLAILGFKFWQRRMGHSGDMAAFAQDRWRRMSSAFTQPGAGRRWRPFATGNAAFDDWKDAELNRLETERRRLEEAEREFADFLHTLRQARDREEFDRFMAERRSQGGTAV